MVLWSVAKRQSFFRLLVMFPSAMERTFQMTMDLTPLIYPSFWLLNVHAFCPQEMHALLAYISSSEARKAIWFCVSVSLLFIQIAFISHFTWIYVVFNLTMKKVVVFRWGADTLYSPNETKPDKLRERDQPTDPLGLSC